MLGSARAVAEGVLFEGCFTRSFEPVPVRLVSDVEYAIHIEEEPGTITVSLIIS